MGAIPPRLPDEVDPVLVADLVPEGHAGAEDLLGLDAGQDHHHAEGVVQRRVDHGSPDDPGVRVDPLVDLESMIRWNADWLGRDMPLHQKPTHYQERFGDF